MAALTDAGFFARRKKMKRDAERILIEDALKVIYDFEDKNIPCTSAGIGRALQISPEKSRKLFESLKSAGLVQKNENAVYLTGEGRSYALRVIRSHRLLEKYYAEKTGMLQSEWHTEAETEEHFLSGDEADKLAASMGNPLFDPHGDPIPAADGVVYEKVTKPLSLIEPGEIVRIVHIEDEPAAVYAQLTALKLYPGLKLKLVEYTSSRIVIIAHGEEIILAPLVAENIFTEELPAEEKVLTKYQTLDTLKQGETAVVKGISNACIGQQRRRLMDLGVVPGSRISAELVSTWANPVAYKIRGALIALRKEHTQLIYINDIAEEVSE